MANDINIVVAAQVQGALGPLQQVQKQVGAVDRSVNQSTATLRRNANQYDNTAVAANKFAKGALQQAGYQIGDFAVQVANGTSKMQAFGQQGSQMLGIFGPVGAVLGAVVAIVSAFAVAFERAGKAGQKFGGDIQGSLGSLKSAYSDVEDAQERYNEAIAAAAVVQSKTSEAVIAALGRELQARQTLLRLQQAEYRIQREGASANLESLNDQVQRLFDINQLFMRGGMIDNPISSAGQYLPAWKQIVEENRTLFLQQARSRAELQLVDSILAQINLALGEAIDSTDTTAKSAEEIVDHFERAQKVIQDINASSKTRLADLRAELALRTSGQGDEEVRVQQAIINARRQAVAEGITGARQLRIISANTAEIERAIIAAEQAIAKATGQTADFADEMERAARAVQNINVQAFEKLQQLQAEVRGRTRGLTDEQVRVQQAAIAAERAAIAAGVDGATELNAIAAEAARLEREIIAAENAIAGFASTSGSATSRIKDNVRSISPELDDIRKRMQQISKAMESSMEGAFMSMVDGTKSVKDAFRTMAADIIKELYRVLVVQRLVAGISNAFSLFTGPAPGSTASILGTPKAQGGAVGPNKMYPVGERGVEMFVPSTSGRIIPNHQLGNGGGNGVTIVQNINVSTGVQQTVRAEIKQLMPQIAESAKSAVVDAKRRGGSYGRAFA
jgi:hypothetical protein